MFNQAVNFNCTYDLTRLTERMHAKHPTGIDRVDLHYALWSRSIAREWQAVVQDCNGFVCLAEDYVDRLLGCLSQAWVDCDSSGTRLSLSQPEAWSRSTQEALREKFARVRFSTLLAERGLVAALWSRLPCVSRGCYTAASKFWENCSDATYVNIGHCFRFEAAMQSIPDSVRRIYFLHDVIPLTHSDCQKATSAAHFKRFCEYVGRPNSDVIVSSQATVDAMANLAPQERKLLDSAASMRVCPLAVEDRFMAKGLEGLKPVKLEGLKGTRGLKTQESDYFLAVGTIEPRKNLELLVRVWEQLIKSGQCVPKLIWVGQFGWSNNKQLMRRFEKLQKLGYVELYSGLSDSELLCRMQYAFAVLFPSKIEGWGLPLSEALSMRVPVLASDIAIFREVGQGVPELLELNDAAKWYHAILNYAQKNSKLRAAQMARMDRYRVRSWPEHFQQVEDFLSLK